MRLRLSILVVFIGWSCHQDGRKLELDFGQFKIQVPVDWSKVKIESTDSYITGIVTEKNDTIFFDIGQYSRDIEKEEMLYVFDSLEFEGISERQLQDLTKGFYLVVPDLERKIELIDSLNKERQHTYYQDSVDCFVAKFFVPKKETGYTGLYIDNLNRDLKSNEKIKISILFDLASLCSRAAFLIFEDSPLILIKW